MPLHPVYGHYENGWKVISDFPNYSVNELSQVTNIKRKRMLKHDSKFSVHLRNKNEMIHAFIYNLSLTTFFPHIKRNGRTVDHIKEGDRSNNHIENLQWLTQKQQNIKSSKLQPRNGGPKRSRAIEQWSLDGTTKIAEFVSSMAAERECKSQNIFVWNAHISACANGRRKSCGGFIWKLKYDITQDNLENEEFKTSEKLKEILGTIKIQGKPLTKHSISKIKVSNKGRILTATGIKTKGKIGGNQPKYRFYYLGIAKLVWSVFGDRQPGITAHGEKEFICHDLSIPLDEDGCFSNAIEHLRLDTASNVAVQKDKIQKSKSILKKRKHSEIEKS